MLESQINETRLLYHDTRRRNNASGFIQVISSQTIDNKPLYSGFWDEIIYIYIYNMYVYIYGCIYIWMFIYVCIYIYIYIFKKILLVPGQLIVTTPIQWVKLPTTTVTRLPFPLGNN